MGKKAAITAGIFTALIGAVFAWRIFFASSAAKRILDVSVNDQYADILARRVIRVGNSVLSVLIADSSRARRQGLSLRDGLLENEGMLFVFEKSEPHSFWMKNMKFPLDIIWFSEDRNVVDIAENAPAEGNDPRVIYKPKRPALYALEVVAGWARNHNVVSGTRFSFCESKLCDAKLLSVLPSSESRALSQVSVLTARSKLTEKQYDGESAHTLPNQLSKIAKIAQKVPFSPQAPFGEWSDDRQEDGCEEATIIMAHYWKDEKSLTRQQMLSEIFSLSAYEKKTYGYYNDTSAEDTAKLFRDYYKADGVSAMSDVSAASIKRELAAGRLVIAPMNGQALHNPYYISPGPPRHMILVIGYDDALGEFITNDPGTRRGDGYRYQYDVFVNAIRDYPSGRNISGQGGKTMIVVGK